MAPPTSQVGARFFSPYRVFALYGDPAQRISVGPCVVSPERPVSLSSSW